MNTERLQSFKPGAREYNHEDVEFVVNCWKCNRDFTIHIGMGNMNQTVFDCTHCKETNEIE